MSYMSDVCDALTQTLTKTTTLPAHQLAGHAANIDFWVNESKHCLEVLDGYYSRFEKMRDAQKDHVRRHGTYDYEVEKGEIHDADYSIKPLRPGVGEGDLKKMRHEIDQATYAFLVRCHRERFIDAAKVREFAAHLGMSVSERDLQEV